MDQTGLAAIRAAIFLAVLILFLTLELAIPYRRPSQPKTWRWGVNLGLTGVNSLVMWLGLGALPILAAAHASSQGAGFLPLIPGPYWLRFLVAIAFLDFMLWVWHLLNHVVPLLWRFHRVHHTDLNMDVSTATRFHLGELAASRFIQAGLVYLVGADVYMVAAFDILVVACAQFHHSSLKIPARAERWIWPLAVPPSMHRIHHSVKIKQRNSNYGTIFSFWDRIMGTMVKNVDQAGIVIGVGGHFKRQELGLGRLLAQPFRRPVR